MKLYKIKINNTDVKVLVDDKKRRWMDVEGLDKLTDGKMDIAFEIIIEDSVPSRVKFINGFPFVSEEGFASAIFCYLIDEESKHMDSEVIEKISDFMCRYTDIKDAEQIKIESDVDKYLKKMERKW